MVEKSRIDFPPSEKTLGFSETPEGTENCYSSGVCVVGDGNSLSLFSICDTVSEASVQVSDTTAS